VCIKAKLTCQEIPKVHQGEHATRFGQEIWSDLWGPLSAVTLGGCRYFVSFTDDHSHWTIVYLLQTKDILEAYKVFEAWVEKHLDTGIACLHSDRGGEYMLMELIAYLDSRGTAQKLTTHDTPEQNGVSEWLNCTLMEKVCAMLWAAGLQQFLWGEALLHTTYLKNWTLTKGLNGHTPYGVVNGHPPDLNGIPEWGCKVWVHTTTSGKVSSHASEGHWVGYDDSSTMSTGQINAQSALKEMLGSQLHMNLHLSMMTLCSRGRKMD
jgi:hypothetical protein